MRVAPSTVLLATVAGLAGLGGFLAHRHTSDARSADAVGNSRFDFALKDIDGQTRSVTEWDGKVLVVNFWATWCAPCREEIPEFVKLQEEFAADGVQFIGVAVDRLDAVRQFVSVIPINYPVLIGDEDGSISRHYGNDLGALPYTVVIDRQGKIAATRRGIFPPAEVNTVLRKLL